MILEILIDFFGVTNLLNLISQDHDRNGPPLHAEVGLGIELIIILNEAKGFEHHVDYGIIFGVDDEVNQEDQHGTESDQGFGLTVLYVEEEDAKDNEDEEGVPNLEAGIHSEGLTVVELQDSVVHTVVKEFSAE